MQGREVAVIRLDPLLIGSIFPIHGEDRIVVAPDQVPPLLPAALKAVEDRKFDSHHGVNPLAILRAKLILSGTIDRAVTVRGLMATKGARAAVEKAGGRFED